MAQRRRIGFQMADDSQKSDTPSGNGPEIIVTDDETADLPPGLWVFNVTKQAEAILLAGGATVAVGSAMVLRNHLAEGIRQGVDPRVSMGHSLVRVVDANANVLVATFPTPGPGGLPAVMVLILSEIEAAQAEAEALGAAGGVN